MRTYTWKIDAEIIHVQKCFTSETFERFGGSEYFYAVSFLNVEREWEPLRNEKRCSSVPASREEKNR